MPSSSQTQENFTISLSKSKPRRPPGSCRHIPSRITKDIKLGRRTNQYRRRKSLGRRLLLETLALDCFVTVSLSLSLSLPQSSPLPPPVSPPPSSTPTIKKR